MARRNPSDAMVANRPRPHRRFTHTLATPLAIPRAPPPPNPPQALAHPQTRLSDPIYPPPLALGRTNPGITEEAMLVATWNEVV